MNNVVKKVAMLMLLAMLIVNAFPVQAVPAYSIPRTHEQSDGTVLTVILRGDERFHSYVTTDGLTLVQQDNGDYVYDTALGASTVLAHNPSERGTAETQFIAAQGAELSLSTRYASAVAKRNARRKEPAQESDVPTTGTPRIPIILVQYSDVSFKDSVPVATYREVAMGVGEKSYNQYFKDQSRGAFDPQFDVYGVVTLPNNRAYYGGRDRNGNDERPGLMVKQACDAMNGRIDFAQYDNNGDGFVDCVILIYAGVGQASSGQSSAVWPCQWTLEDDTYSGTGIQTYDGVKVNKFAVFNELAGNYRDIDGIGTFCHEFSHCLGLPDVYDVYSSSQNIFAMEDWSVMDSGCYADDGHTPVGYSAFERASLGWLQLQAPEENTSITMQPLTYDDGVAYKLVNQANSNEYFVLENRQQTGWDSYLPGHGMMITHIDYDQQLWDNNTINISRSHKHYYIVCADNSFIVATEGQDLFPCNGKFTSFTDETEPAAEFYTGDFLGKPITNIAEENGVVTFDYCKTNGIEAVNAAGSVVTSVTYYNLAGMSSNSPFNGLNIVVRRYADGTRVVSKQIEP